MYNGTGRPSHGSDSRVTSACLRNAAMARRSRSVTTKWGGLTTWLPDVRDALPPPVAGLGDDPEGFDLLAPLEAVEDVAPHLLGEQPAVQKLLCDLLGAPSSRIG